MLHRRYQSTLSEKNTRKKLKNPARITGKQLTTATINQDDGWIVCQQQLSFVNIPSNILTSFVVREWPKAFERPLWRLIMEPMAIKYAPMNFSNTILSSAVEQVGMPDWRCVNTPGGDNIWSKKDHTNDNRHHSVELRWTLAFYRLDQILQFHLFPFLFCTCCPVG